MIHNQIRKLVKKFLSHIKTNLDKDLKGIVAKAQFFINTLLINQS